ncbi:hypothetical protein ACFLVW_00900 [Chloroflexota bacterium]
MVNTYILPPLNISALTELWDFLRLDSIEKRRLEVLQTEDQEALHTYDVVLKFLNNYILIAEGRMPEELLDSELRRMFPVIRKAVRLSEPFGTGTANEILLGILQKLEKMAKLPRLYSRADKILALDQLASFWHSGAFNLGGELSSSGESLTFVARTVFRTLASSKEKVLEEEKERFNRNKELGILVLEDQWQWRTENCETPKP